MDWITGMTTVYKDLFNNIRCKFVEEVTDILGIPTHFDNASFTQPQGSEWVRFSILPESSRQVDFGAAKRRFRVLGVAIAVVSFPIGGGDAGNMEVADAIVDVFRGVTFQGVIFRTPSVSNLGRKGDEWQTEISCPFIQDNLI